LAFEDELGFDGSQQVAQNYTLGATGLVSKTISLWTSRIVQYILIVGIISAVFVGLSVVLLSTMFGLIGSIGADPFGYVIEFILDPTSNLTLLAVSAGFALVSFVVNAIINGAATKFTLDEYGGRGGDIGASFSHSISRVVHIIIIQIILGLLVSIILTPATFFAFSAMDMIDITDPFNPIIPPGALEMLAYAMFLMLIGGIFLIYIQVRFLPAYAVVIDSDLSAIDSLKRSWELTSENFFHVFGSYILLVIAVAVLGMIVGVVISIILYPLTYAIILESIITALLFSAITYIFTAVLYRDLSSRKGTSDLPQYVL
jgi:hypothetical protein